MDWGFESVKEIVEYIAENDGYFWGFLLILGIVAEFVIRMTNLIFTKGIVKLFKMIFKGIGKLFNKIEEWVKRD